MLDICISGSRDKENEIRLIEKKPAFFPRPYN